MSPTNLDQNRIFEASPSRENEFIQILYWTKKSTPGNKVGYFLTE